MLKELVPTPVGTGESLSTPEMWAENFRAVGRLKERHRRSMIRDQRWFLIDKHMRSGGDILDAGCGAGEWPAFLQERGYRVTGVDYSTELVGRLKEMYPRGDWKSGSIVDLPLAASSFDGIISWGVIEHDEDGPQAALREFLRVLRPGGKLIVTVPLHDKWNERASTYLIKLWAKENLKLSRPVREVFFQYYMKESELAAFVSKAGFQVIETGKLPPALLGKALPHVYHATKGNRILSGLLHRLFAALFAWDRRWYHMIYCVAERPR